MSTLTTETNIKSSRGFSNRNVKTKLTVLDIPVVHARYGSLWPFYYIASFLWLLCLWPYLF